MRQTMTLVAIGLLGGAAASGCGEDESVRVAHDPVVSSFERDLNRQPIPTAMPRRESIDEDVLYKEMNAIHWTEKQDIDTDDIATDPRSENED